MYISTELIKQKKDLSEEQYALLNEQLVLRLGKKLKTTIGYRVVYYSNQKIKEAEARLDL